MYIWSGSTASTPRKHHHAEVCENEPKLRIVRASYGHAAVVEATWETRDLRSTVAFDADALRHLLAVLEREQPD